jgi:glyoxylase-like metal-dependent hydrolase (beta-lactamase superfamily II)
MLAENYQWHQPHGLEQPNEADRRDMLAQLGGDAPVDLGLRGGETLRLGPGRRLEVLHLPGHKLGQLGVWDSATRTAIVIDAALYDGIYDRAGNKLIPPRYYDVAAYRHTIQRIAALEPELLLTGHYQPMGRTQARAFCERSTTYVDAVEAIVSEQRATGEMRLKELTDRVNESLGPFPEFATEIAAGVRSHLAAAR